MSDEHADILSMLDVTREEIFSVASNTVPLYDERDRVHPFGEAYFRNGHFGIRVGDYDPTNIHRILG